MPRLLDVAKGFGTLKTPGNRIANDEKRTPWLTLPHQCRD
jgi:hypothetical protein